jgi:hypothetical protein
MRPLACDRSRAWISLRLDDELSKFEHVLLGAHMAMCRDCRQFADHVEWQTKAIRSAGLEPLTQPVTIPARRSWRWPAVGVSTAAVAGSVAALAIGLRAPTPQEQPAAPFPRVPSNGEMLGVKNPVVKSMADQSAAQSAAGVGALRGDRG